MDYEGETPKILVIVRHPEQGTKENGGIICGKILEKLAKTSGLVCFFHDATDMTNANIGYAGAFKNLDKALEKRTVEVVCAIPGTIPRMMAQTVAMVSSKKWKIFKDREAALGYLSGIGYTLSASEFKTLEDVSLRIEE